MAGKIAMVAELIKSNPGMIKKDLVALVVKELGVPKQNAYVYIFNANKKLAKGDVVKARKPSKMAETVVSAASKTAKSKTSRAEIVQKSDDEVARIKEDRLKMIKNVADRRKAEQQEMDAERKAAKEEMDAYAHEADEYVKSLTSSTRKFLLGAE